ncbi:hypothetical protein ERO13_A01G131800v2 [Gossypium hirsutum]|nr:hypothetical protein ERO13_A01G131800v2 [Gossypium hirsutum]KAG4214592.1 hypothetical protein ERO13_A01G131800v2 [Gossypium hirsutum]
MTKNSTPFDPRPYLHTSEIFGLSSASIQENPYKSTSGDAREGLMAHVWCSSESLAVAREGEPLGLLKQSPGLVL